MRASLQVLPETIALASVAGSDRSDPRQHHMVLGTMRNQTRIYIFPIIAVANSLHLTLVAPSICRAKS